MKASSFKFCFLPMKLYITSKAPLYVQDLLSIYSPKLKLRSSSSNLIAVAFCNLKTYHKIPKISPAAYIFQRPLWRGLSIEGNLSFKIDWASPIDGRKFTVFALFYFVFEGNFQVLAPGGAYIWRGDLMEGFFFAL